MLMEGGVLAVGVTAFDASEAADHPAPVRAATVNVYAVPLTRPDTVHVNDVVRHVWPPGLAVTR